MAELPYFDLLINEQQDGSEVGQLWENQVHWGYWEDPKAATCTKADYVAAMARMNTVLFEAGKVDDGQKLLDAGCGFGGTVQHLNAEHSNMHLTGLNIDGRQLAAAEAQTKPANGNTIEWVEADACQLPFEDNSFDRVLAVECIFHFPSRERFLAEATRVLKPGGYLAVSDFVPTLMFFGKTPFWMAIRTRIAKTDGLRVPVLMVPFEEATITNGILRLAGPVGVTFPPHRRLSWIVVSSERVVSTLFHQGRARVV